MNRITRTRALMVVAGAVLLCGMAGCAANGGAAPAARDPQAAHAFSQEQLDQMLAPIALYPDPLLSQMLMAATYPLEVVEAARWSRGNAGYQGDEAVRAVQQYDWDPSVKSLVAFPLVLQTMDQKLEWTEDVGEAFLAQPAQVMETIQKLRRRAYAAGYLRSNSEVRVDAGAQFVYIEYASSDVVYVPYYDSTVVYGTWWWADYPPEYWAPWPGYYVVSGYAWGSATYVSTGFFFGTCDWRERRVDVVNARNYYYAASYQNPSTVSRYVNTAPGAWQHNPEHRRGVPYREPQLRREFGRAAGAGASPRYVPGYQPSSPAYAVPAGQQRFGAVRGIGAGAPGGDNRFAPGSQYQPVHGASGAASPGAGTPQRVWTQQGAQPVQNPQGFQVQPGSPPAMGVAQRVWTQQGAQPVQNPQGFQVQPGSPPAMGAAQRVWTQQSAQPVQNPQGFQMQPGSPPAMGVAQRVWIQQGAQPAQVQQGIQPGVPAAQRPWMQQERLPPAPPAQQASRAVQQVQPRPAQPAPGIPAGNGVRGEGGRPLQEQIQGGMGGGQSQAGGGQASSNWNAGWQGGQGRPR